MTPEPLDVGVPGAWSAPLPDGWEIKPLRNLCFKPEYGYTESATKEPVGPKFLRITDIQNGRVEWGSVPYCPCSSKDLQKYRLSPGDLLFARIGATTGKSYYITDAPEAVYASYLIRLRPRSIDGRFLYYFCQSHLYWDQINAGKGEKLKGGVSGGSLADLRVCVPPPDDQRAIATLLHAIDTAIRNEEDRVAILTELKASTAAELFCRGLRNEPLRPTELGDIPESWRVVPLGEVILKAQYGLSIRGEKSGRYPILRMNCQKDGTVAFHDLQYVNLDEETHRQFRLNHGDLLFNRTNSIDLVGRTAIFQGDRDAVFASYMIRLELDTSQMMPEFLNFYLNQSKVQESLKSLATRGVSQSNISASKLKTFPVPCPSDISEQQDVASTLERISTAKIVAEARLAALRELFTSTLESLINGRLSLPNSMSPAEVANA